MKTALLLQLLDNANFSRTATPITDTIIVHGVPGCGKSTLIKDLVTKHSTIAYTLGVPYGRSLIHTGINHISRIDHNIQKFETRILDEYQLGNEEDVKDFTLLFGDPFQGTFQLQAHFIKRLSHRVPRQICHYLESLDYDIVGETEGEINFPPIYATNSTGPIGTVLHLGPVSRQLTRTFGICSKLPTEVQGLEFEEVTLVYHSSELQANRELFFVAVTRARRLLNVLTDSKHRPPTCKARS
uniref:TGB1 n=1 Tax=Garlic virus C TaxID=12431 RepID=A0A6M2YTP0_9VIRU|nr:TGB1 [Garlic virus C]